MSTCRSHASPLNDAHACADDSDAYSRSSTSIEKRQTRAVILFFTNDSHRKCDLVVSVGVRFSGILALSRFKSSSRHSTGGTVTWALLCSPQLSGAYAPWCLFRYLPKQQAGGRRFVALWLNPPPALSLRTPACVPMRDHANNATGPRALKGTDFKGTQTMQHKRREPDGSYQ